MPQIPTGCAMPTLHCWNADLPVGVFSCSKMISKKKPMPKLPAAFSISAFHIRIAGLLPGFFLQIICH